MKRLNCFLYFLLIVTGGHMPKLAAQDTNLQTTKSFILRGVVRQIADDRREVTIQHEAIAGYMPAMTMEFNVRDTNELNGISPADEITFKLDIGENDSWIEHIHFIAHRVEVVTNNTFVFHVPTSELKPGDMLPDCEFVAEDGNVIHLSDFRGKAVAFTFFYSRCPLPDYCPRMSKNFYETRQLLLTTSNTPANWQLLSISFDPGFDNSEMLSSYASFFRGGDTNRWLFATAPTNTLAHLAPQLDLMIMRDGVNIMSHNLRTVVLDPQGHIFRQFDGNQWTPQELANAILQAARVQTNSMP
jgi:protein SCO1/2